ncbi:hypothetical protein GGX14DRAFT_568621 [Mycena pura]|uniref:F-box domain-containing protein n=1 Tax=Mycena pura TaxID=153505 RepID=A0AAD6Y8P2_9AGAR|nr:hypothetical protein GGX14DRAFT_568621 [Mycena pura]
MRVRNTFPNEIWLEILKHLPHHSLLQTSLTARGFCHLARPLLFLHFSIRPRGRTSTLSSAQAKKRLHFWLSDEIAPFVHSCTISRSHRGAGWYITNPPNPLFDVLLDNLQRFTNLQRLSVEGATFTGTAMSTLSGMLTLRHLDIEGCKVEAVESLEYPHQALALSSFAFADKQMFDCRLYPWIPFFCPDHLRELQLHCTPHRLYEKTQEIPLCPHVHRLSMDWFGIPINDCLAVLSRFPSTQVLRICDRSSDPAMDSLGSNAIPDIRDPFPVLRELTTPYNYLPTILPRAALTQLTVFICEPSELISSLEGLDLSMTIDYLNLELYNLK